MFDIIHSSADLDAAIAKSHEHPIVLFKHSATCPFSAKAQEAVANAKHDIDIYGIVVQYAEDLKMEIEQKTGVNHASPQAIVLHNGKAKWVGFRSEITQLNLLEQVKGN
jgi:bacillithiol system protein YtxJ